MKKLKEKEQCEVCGIVEGGKLCHEVLTLYHEHNVCSFCLHKWEMREQDLGHSIEWDNLPTRWILGRK